MLFGIPVAMLIAGSRTAEAHVYPLLAFSQSIPKVAIAPLFVAWFGFGPLPKVIAAFLPAIFAGLSYFYLSNVHTLSVIFGRDLLADPAKEERLAHMVELVLKSLRA